MDVTTVGQLAAAAAALMTAAAGVVRVWLELRALRAQRRPAETRGPATVPAPRAHTQEDLPAVPAARRNGGR